MNDVKAFLDDLNAKINPAQLRSIFRGHQHSETFSYRKLGDPDSVQPSSDTIFATKYDLTTDNKLVFTFSTAAEGIGLGWDCFGILTVAKEYEKWNLSVYAKNLNKLKNAPSFRTTLKPSAYVKISKKYPYNPSVDDPIEITYSDTVLANPLDPNLIGLEFKLMKLKTSLSSLKGKLEVLKTKLGNLRVALGTT